MSEYQPKSTHPDTTIRVSAPARLHLGFLDLNGTTGRKFGSLGLAIDSHKTVIEVDLASEFTFDGIASESILHKVSELTSLFYNSLGKSIPEEQRGVSISFKQLIPEHSGLGSGTQLALCVGTALAKLHNLPCSTSEIAAALGRGKRSGIGITTFDRGGFVADAGLGKNSDVPALIAHFDFPEEWRMVLIMVPESQGVHGATEINAFKTLPTFPLSASNTICHLTLMKLLPAIVERDLAEFSEAVTAIQGFIGDHFAPAQGGRYSNTKVATLLEFAQKQGYPGIAQSSWGPTGCVFVENETLAIQLQKELEQHANQIFNRDHQLSFCIAKANANGANIDMISPN